MKRASIKTKLIKANVLTVLFAFVVVGVIIAVNMNTLFAAFSLINEQRSSEVEADLQKSSHETASLLHDIYEKSLQDKGLNLLERDKLVLHPLFIDNSFNDIRNLLSNLFALDEEILSLAFYTVEDKEIKSWQFLDRQFPQGLGLKVVYNRETESWESEKDGKKISLKDERILKIIKQGKPRINKINYEVKSSDGTSRTVEAYECVTAIFDGEMSEFEEFIEDGEVVGFLRYILTLEKMQVAVMEEQNRLGAKLEDLKRSNELASQASAKATGDSIRSTLINLSLGAVLVLFLSFAIAVVIGNKVSRPILALKESAQKIAMGDYSQEVKIDSDDEIGILGENFDDMRVQVRQFTENLQELVDEKTKEISDILNSIDQGIFTINMDLSVNAQHSKKAGEIFSLENFQDSSLKKIFAIDDDKLTEFSSWLQLIKNPNKIKRWKKYSELSPVHEIIQSVQGAERIIELDYRPILDGDSLSKLMILSKDVTEERIVRAALKRTKQEQYLTMERVFALVNNDEDYLRPFMEDVSSVIDGLEVVDLVILSSDGINNLFRDVHTLKGNAGSYGFNEISRMASPVEDFLEKAKAIKVFTPQHCSEFNVALGDLKGEYEAITAMRSKLFTGSQDGMTVSRTKFNRLLSYIRERVITDLDLISYEMDQLGMKEFFGLCRKYQNVIVDYRSSYDKKIADLEVKTPNILIHPDLMRKFDMAITHLVRNSLDHGIESDEERAYAGKGVGRISISFAMRGDDAVLQIEDNGCGISAELIAGRAFAKGVISESELVAMSHQEKIELIFHPGFSTKNDVSFFSGRGVGMDAAKESIEKCGGRVQLKTEVGIGTRVILSLPVESK